jgi:beta-mannanase
VKVCVPAFLTNQIIGFFSIPMAKGVALKVPGALLRRVAELEPVGTVFIWGLWEPEPYSEYGSGYKEMKQKTRKNLLDV